MTTCFLEAHADKDDDQRTIGGRVCPSEDGIELGVAAIDVTFIVRSWSRTRLRSVTTNDLIPSIDLEVSICLGEQSSSNQVQETG